MIKVSRLNNQEFMLNPHLIESIEATPDTVITLTTGKKLMVKETVREVVEKIISYRRGLGRPIFTEADTGTIPEDDVDLITDK